MSLSLPTAAFTALILMVSYVANWVNSRDENDFWASFDLNFGSYGLHSPPPGVQVVEVMVICPGDE